MSKKIALLALALLSGCATGYQEAGFFTNGYSDARLASDRFIIVFNANEQTPSDKVFEYALRRASEIAWKNGYRYFTVTEVERAGSAKARLHYPSVQISIQCFHEPPSSRDVYDVRERVHT